MMKICSKKLETLVLSGILVIGVALLGGCAERITAIQAIKDISVKEVYDLIGKNSLSERFTTCWAGLFNGKRKGIHCNNTKFEDSSG